MAAERPQPPDPVRLQRARMGRLSVVAQRVGYGLFLVAAVLFFVGFATGYSPALVTTIVASLVVGSLVLAPAIVLGYAVRAAEREDRASGI
jgi:uncharacterized membrane protein YGL010W